MAERGANQKGEGRLPESSWRVSRPSSAVARAAEVSRSRSAASRPVISKTLRTDGCAPTMRMRAVAFFAQSLVGADEHAEARRVDERHAAELERDVARAALDERVQLGAQLR